jgi:hypothetical protein
MSATARVLDPASTLEGGEKLNLTGTRASLNPSPDGVKGSN